MYASRLPQTLTWIIVVAAVWLLVRVSFVTSREGDLPFQSANDRSRWCTTSALVDYGTYAIDEVIRRRGWDTIDKVAHPGRDGQLNYYSSKPTLLPTLLAIPYWMIKATTGWTLASHPLLVGRLIVAAVNGALLLTLLVPLRSILLRETISAWTAVYVMSFAAFGTYLTSFAVTINNHLVAAAAVMASAAAYLYLRDGQAGPSSVEGAASATGMCAIAGLCGAFAVTNELPAMVYFVGIGALCTWHSPHGSGRGFVPAAMAVFAAAALTNWWAHESLLPPYAHREPGGDWTSGNWYVYPGSYWSSGSRSAIDQGEPSVGRYAFHTLVGHHGIFSLTPVWLLLAFAFGRNRRPTRRAPFVGLVLVVTIVCLAFYIFLRPQTDRNYGGRSVAFRWSLWLIPLWWILLIGGVERVSQWRWGRWIAVVMLLGSIASAGYGWFLPWKHPWLYPAE